MVKKIYGKVKEYIQRHIVVFKFNRFMSLYTEYAIRDFYNHKITEEQLKLFQKKALGITEQIKLFEEEKKQELIRKQAAKLKGPGLNNEYLRDAKNELYILKYNYAQIEKTKPAMAPAIKAKETKLRNLQEKIDYMNSVISNLTSFKQKKQSKKIETPKQNN